MLDHLTIRVSDLEASARFYTTVLATLDAEPPVRNDFGVEFGDFSLAQATAEQPATRGLHVGFAAPSREAVDAFFRAGVDAGFASDGDPGPRPQYTDDYYGGFLLDPDGNSIEAAHMSSLADNIVDHVWIRVASVAASRAAYLAIADAAALSLVADEPALVRFRGRDGFTFTLLSDDRPLTQNVHLAFAFPGSGAVEAFHTSALAAGWRDNGAPGERPEYHPGYLAAFALDPDGHNIEVVDHQR
ncbi:MAG TPA: VOC family protein [Solirubrobacteraceae bacterium]|nr:VOC family protein [Solirubrobacteraceae bacterium]